MHIIQIKNTKLISKNNKINRFTWRLYWLFYWLHQTTEHYISRFVCQYACMLTIAMQKYSLCAKVFTTLVVYSVGKCSPTAGGSMTALAWLSILTATILFYIQMYGDAAGGNWILVLLCLDALVAAWFKKNAASEFSGRFPRLILWWCLAYIL